jgi:hypothetical protein
MITAQYWCEVWIRAIGFEQSKCKFGYEMGTGVKILTNLLTVGEGFRHLGFYGLGWPSIAAFTHLLEREGFVTLSAVGPRSRSMCCSISFMQRWFGKEITVKQSKQWTIWQVSSVEFVAHRRCKYLQQSSIMQKGRQQKLSPHHWPTALLA